jgi:tetratricopeptide (TPR) repeat protein
MNFKSLFADVSALIIDDMANQQASLKGQLAMLEIARVDAASTVDDALRLLKSRRYTVVMCDYNLNQRSDGQQLLEHLRENGLLPPETIFFMVTAEASYAAVASASEHKPDAYLLKPVTVGDIEERLRTQIERRAALAKVHQRQGLADLPGVVAACDELIQRKDRFTMSALQIKGSTLLQLGRHEEANELYAQVLSLRPGLIWAQLGMARAQRAAGNFEEAKALSYEVMRSKDGEKNVEAYDLIAQCLEAQGDMEGALWTLRDSAAVMPSARRQRLLGECAFRNGDLATAKECFTKLAKSTKGSITGQPQDALMLAQVKTDTGEHAEAVLILDQAQSQNRHDPAFANVALALKAQALFKGGDKAGAEAALSRARQAMRRPKADFSTVALAKAELLGGHEEAGLKLLAQAVSADHENPRVKQLIGNALKDTGHDGKLEQVVSAAVGGLNAKVSEARSLFRNSQIDEALEAIERAQREFPENSAVLLQAAQMNCMALRLKKQMNHAASERVRAYLIRLDGLLPGSDRVAQMHRYYRETLAMLKSGQASTTALAA